MTILKMEELELSGLRVLIREDLNVPIEDGKITNQTRIRAAVPTIRLALEKGASVILMSHLGRPEEGKPIEQQAELSLRPVADCLCEILGLRVNLCQDYLSNPSSTVPAPGEITLLENVRVNAGEKADDDALARKYASLCDVFVMDAFGTAHRAQASTHGVAKFAAQSCAGPLLCKELEALDRSLKNPKRPMMAIVGGAKVSSKLRVLESLSSKVDQLLVGGGIANTFLAAAGFNVGKSLYEPDLIESATTLMNLTEIPLPVDVVVAKALSADAVAEIKAIADIGDDDLILDIGPETSARLTQTISTMETIIWNGPMGVFEFDQFAAGTEAVARAVANNAGFSIAGGGETIAAIDKFGITDKVSYISTGGGAFLEFVQGVTLPAVKILEL